MDAQEIYIKKIKETSIADKYFEKIHYNRLIEITDSDAKVIYASRWRDHRHSQDRVYATLLKIQELEKFGFKDDDKNGYYLYKVGNTQLLRIKN